MDCCIGSAKFFFRIITSLTTEIFRILEASDRKIITVPLEINADRIPVIQPEIVVIE